VTDILPLAANLAALASALILLGLSLGQLLQPAIGFWPPPAPESWQSRLFRALFRVLFYGLLIGSFAWLWQNGAAVSPLRIGVSALLFCIGFGVALAATGALGWGNAFGAQDGLRTTGIFAYSRNPIYLATFFGLAGWGLLVSEPMIRVVLILWAILYVVAVFLEERWLSERYGADFDAYRNRVRRFV